MTPDSISQFFQLLLGDVFSGAVLAFALHVLSLYLRKLTHNYQTAVRNAGFLMGVITFITSCVVEYILHGPNWMTIVILSAVRAWLVGACGSLLTAFTLLPIIHFPKRKRRSQDQRPRHTVPQTPPPPTPALPAPSPPPLPPPPPGQRLQQAADRLIQEFQRHRDIIEALPLDEEILQNRIEQLEDQIDRRLEDLLDDM